jgi:hypothetical protein
MIAGSGVSRNHKQFLDSPLHEDKPDKTCFPGDSGPQADGVPRPDEKDVDDAETQMRRALGLVGTKPVRDEASPAPMRRLSLGSRSSEVSSLPRLPRRFVQDGEVPVTLVKGRWTQAPGADQPVTNRLAVAEAAAEAERSKREQVEHSLQDSHETIRGLQTKQAHIELARDEALQALKQSAELLESLHAALRGHQEQLAAMQAAVKASDRAVRAGSRALSAERAARVAAETALQEADAARQSPKKKVRVIRRSSEEPARRRMPGSSTRKGSAKTSHKASKPRKAGRKSVAASTKPKRQRTAVVRKPVTTIRKKGRRLGKRRL